MIRMPKTSFLALFTLAATCLAVHNANALTGREIMEKVDARDDGDNRTATLEMTLIDKQGNKRIRRVKTFRKDKGRDTLSMMFFLEPADVRRTGFLTYDYYGPEKDDDQWLYLPALRKTKRIASSDKSSAFMGTDFSYADMTKRVLDEWNFKLLKEGEVRGHKVWLVEALPANETVRDRYGYTKSVVFVRQDNFVVVRGVDWVKEGRKIKYMDVKKLEKIDGIWVATTVDMKTTRNGKTQHRTVMTFSDMKFGQPLEESTFSVRNLEKGL